MIAIPPNLQEWLRTQFRASNVEASSMLSGNPNIHEETLDHALINKLARVSAPRSFSNGWTVRIETHWLGSFPLFFPEDVIERRRGWEIADIGLLVIFSSGGKFVRSKIALLQSKRLFANEDEPETAAEFANRFRIGFGRLFPTDEDLAALTRPRTFTFNANSMYQSLSKGDRQYESVRQYEERSQIPVYYLFYNPLKVPHSLDLPIQGEPDLGSCDIGCRIVPSSQLRLAMNDAESDSHPSFGQLLETLPNPFTGLAHRGGWPLEYFVVDLLLQCKTGRITDIRDDTGLRAAFYQRTRPISAAMAISIDAPQGFDWAVEQ